MSEETKVVDTEKTESVKKADKKTNKKKNGFFRKIGKFFKDVLSELKKIVWPTKKQVINNTLIVVVALVVCGAVIGLFDIGVTALLKFLVSLAK